MYDSYTKVNCRPFFDWCVAYNYTTNSSFKATLVDEITKQHTSNMAAITFVDTVRHCHPYVCIRSISSCLFRRFFLCCVSNCWKSDAIILTVTKAVRQDIGGTEGKGRGEEVGGEITRMERRGTVAVS